MAADRGSLTRQTEAVTLCVTPAFSSGLDLQLPAYQQKPHTSKNYWPCFRNLKTIRL